jgi:hypothetical protein
MPVNYVRKELQAIQKIYTLIRDCIAGQFAIKSKSTTYLPQPNAEDTSPENRARYSAYIERAVFYNVTARTLRGLVGQIFLRDPVIQVPVLLQSVVDDANGEGVSLTQIAKRTVQQVLAYGRSGLFVDYPTTAGGASRLELEQGYIRPTIEGYAPWDIINWRTISRGVKEVLSLIVLRESYVEKDDGFEETLAIRYRVLRLGQSVGNPFFAEYNDFYTVELWESSRDGKLGIAESYQPTDASGNLFDELPFTFVGAENNDSEIDNAPLYDIAALNVAHYRNSADYEESCFVVGQPTPIFSGLTEEWVTNVLKGVVPFGSRGGIPLPIGGDAKLLQAESNTRVFEAMELKERQMVALGAKLVEQEKVQRTATEANLETASENSTLASSAKNVSAAYKWALSKCAEFVGASGLIKFELNTDFDLSAMSATDRAEVVKTWQAGAITFREMRSVMKKAGIATEEDDVAKEQIAQDTADAMALETPVNVPASDAAE